jgi:hypothetical protein
VENDKVESQEDNDKQHINIELYEI